MLVAQLGMAEKNDYVSRRLRAAYAFLRTADVANLPVGRIEIEGDDVFANVQEYETVPASDKELEA
ncbi:MAG: YhcH/YjgK/YiaL family protein, partial [Raoultibacter sp.]